MPQMRQCLVANNAWLFYLQSKDKAMTTPTEQSITEMIAQLRQLVTKQEGYGMSFSDPARGGMASINLYGDRAKAAIWLFKNADNIAEALARRIEAEAVPVATHWCHRCGSNDAPARGRHCPPCAEQVARGPNNGPTWGKYATPQPDRAKELEAFARRYADQPCSCGVLHKVSRCASCSARQALKGSTDADA